MDYWSATFSLSLLCWAKLTILLYLLSFYIGWSHCSEKSLGILSFLEVASEDIRDFVVGLLDFILLAVLVFGTRLPRID